MAPSLPSYRPTRCPSLTCSEWPAAALVSEHISAQHDGSVRGRDVVVRTGASSLVSSYVNVDREPIFYKTTSTSWVANELNIGRCEDSRASTKVREDFTRAFSWLKAPTSSSTFKTLTIKTLC